MDLSALGHRGERQSQIRMDHGEAAHYDAEAVFRTFNPAGPQDAATLKVRTPSLCHTDYSYDSRMDPVQVHTNGIGPGEHGIEKRRPLTHGGLLPPTLPQDALDQNYQATDSGMGYPWPAPLSVAFQCLVPSLPAQGGSGSSHDASSDGMSHSFAPSLLDGDHFNVGPYSSPANTFVDGLCAGYAWGPTSPQAMHDQAFQSLLDGHINSYPLAQSVPRMWIQAEGPLVVEPWTPYRLNPSPADLVLNFPDTGYEEDYEINSGQADMPAQQSTLNTDANHIYQLTSDTSPLCEEAGARSLQALSSQTSEVELVNMPIASRLSASSTLEAHQHVFDARTGSSVHSRSRKQATKAQKDDSHQIRHGGGACRVCKKGKRKCDLRHLSDRDRSTSSLPPRTSSILDASSVGLPPQPPALRRCKTRTSTEGQFLSVPHDAHRKQVVHEPQSMPTFSQENIGSGEQFRFADLAVAAPSLER